MHSDWCFNIWLILSALAFEKSTFTAAFTCTSTMHNAAFSSTIVIQSWLYTFRKRNFVGILNNSFLKNFGSFSYEENSSYFHLYIAHGSEYSCAWYYLNMRSHIFVPSLSGDSGGFHLIHQYVDSLFFYIILISVPYGIWYPIKLRVALWSEAC